MSGSQLATNWICISAAGETVDGRVIEEQWILDAAELYDPAEYTAMLWPEHSRNYGNHGEVLELMTQRDAEGVLKLYARLCPNIRLIQANADGQLLFCSAEFTPDGNYRGTGKTYLEGLGVTDSPASAKTQRLRFSRNKYKRFGELKPMVFEEVREYSKETKGMSGTKKTSWRKLFAIAEQEQPEPEQQQDGDKLQALAEALAALEQRFAELEASQQEVQEDMDTVKEVVDTENFARLVSNLPELVKNFSKLNEKVTRLPSKDFSQQRKKGFNFL